MKKRIQSLNRCQKTLLVITVLMVLSFTPRYAVNADRVNWSCWFLGLAFCVLNAVEILFANEIFRFWMSLRIKNAQEVEPSDRTVKSRYVIWTILAVFALVFFLVGLK